MQSLGDQPSLDEVARSDVATRGNPVPGTNPSRWRRRLVNAVLATSLATTGALVSTVEPAGAATGDITTVAGGGTRSPTVDNANAITRFGNTLYVGDRAGLVLARDLTTDSQTVYAGDPAHLGYSGDNGVATSARLSHVGNLAVNAQGDLFIAEINYDSRDNCHIRVVDHATHIITTLSGSGSCDSTVDGDAGVAGVGEVAAMDVGPDGNLYMIDFAGAVVRRVDHTGHIDIVAGTRSGSGYVDNTDPLSAQFNGMRGLAFDAGGNLYVADGGNDAIRKIDAAFTMVTTIAGGGGSGGVEVDNSGDNSNPVGHGYHDGALPDARLDLGGAAGLAVKPDGSLLISDQNNNRLRKITFGGPPTMSTVAGNGTQGRDGNGGPATAASIQMPKEMTTDASGGIYFATNNNNEVRYIDAQGTIFDRTNPVSNVPIPATDVTLDQPVDLLRIGSDLYVAELGTNRIRKINWKTGMLTTFAGTGHMGSTGDGGPATEAELDGPISLAYDALVGPQGSILVAGFFDHKIRAIDLATNIISTFAGDGTACADSTHACGDGGPASSAQFGLQVSGLAVNASGDVAIADLADHRVRCIGCDKGLPSNYITTIAGTGVQGASSAGVAATQADLIAPVRVIFAPDGSVVFADGCDIFAAIFSQQSVCDSRVLRINKLTGILELVAGQIPSSSHIVSGGDGGLATDAVIAQPVALRYDAAGDLIVGEGGGTEIDIIMSLNNQPNNGIDTDPMRWNPGIRKIDATTGIITTIAGGNGPGLAGDGGPATAAQLTVPTAIAPDSGTHLFVSDLFGNRIRRIEGDRPDLSVTLAGGPFTAGQTGVVHVTVRNASSTAYLTGPVSAAVTLPSALAFQSNTTASGWTCERTGQSVSCSTQNNLAPEETSTFDVTVAVDPNADGVVTVNAQGSSDSDVSNPDAQIAVLGISIRRDAGPSPSPSDNAKPVSESDRGYVLAGGDGATFAFGPAAFPGSVKVPGDRIVGGAGAGAHGAWLTAADGSVFTTGDAQFYGSLGATKLNSPIVGLAAHGVDGYWLVAADGGVFAEGAAGFHGALGAMKLNSPIVGMTPTPSGNGYWLVAADGGVFAEGDAQFFGSLGAAKLNSPIVGIAASPSGHGYTLVASDGGVFAYGDAVFAGSHAGSALRSSIVAIVPTNFGTGYWLVARDGGVFAYGTATFDGSLAAMELNAPIVAAW